MASAWWPVEWGSPGGGPEVAKREKNCSKIALKFDADYGMHLGSENMGKYAPAGRKTDGKECQNRARVDHTANSRARSRI